jgi:hypothetical protein
LLLLSLLLLLIVSAAFAASLLDSASECVSDAAEAAAASNDDVTAAAFCHDTEDEPDDDPRDDDAWHATPLALRRWRCCTYDARRCVCALAIGAEREPRRGQQPAAAAATMPARGAIIRARPVAIVVNVLVIM